MRSRSFGPLSQQDEPQLEPHDADEEWWFTGMINSGVWPTIHAELTNRIAAFTRIPPYRLTRAQVGPAGRDRARACRRHIACAAFTTETRYPP